MTTSSIQTYLLENRNDDCFYIGKVFVSYNARKTKVAIQPGTISINAYAFGGKRSIKYVTLPEGLTHIYGQAFSECGNLALVNLPSSIEYIAPDAFEKCDAVVLKCVEGSYGLQYAKEHGISYEIEA